MTEKPRPAPQLPRNQPPDDVEGIELITPIEPELTTDDQNTDAGTGGAGGGLNSGADGIAGSVQANDDE